MFVYIGNSHSEKVQVYVYKHVLRIALHVLIRFYPGIDWDGCTTVNLILVELQILEIEQQ